MIWHAFNDACEVCGARDAKVWTMQAGRPPLHWHCRCRVTVLGVANRERWDLFLRLGGDANGPIPEWVWR